MGALKPNPFEDSEIHPRGPRGPARSSEALDALSRSKLLRSRRLKDFRKPRRHFERAFVRELAVFALELAPLSARGTPRTSILELEMAVFSKFTHAANVPCAKRPTRQNPVKTNAKRTSELPRIDRNSRRNPFASASGSVW